ncbi:hypothetical protein ACFQGA_00550 [Marinobacter koreensis]|uniref:Nucleotide modification associated domain-containing protein n=1 Tax=Marinobacter koreensis TaxID=335974 RepID=A0ABW0RR23_9GAMM|nr:hypothetical protein [Marinobacter koreensis]MCK7548904.1 hypothetical protein [Marinobacter koreensis]
MRLILSRKGFDSSAGGCPSPVLPDGSLCVLPIPDPRSCIRYSDIQYGGRQLGKIAADLTDGRVGRTHGAHLDPDLLASSLSRDPGWRPLLGQMGAAQGHLRNQGVQAGDLFLFFGVFRQAHIDQRRWRFVPGTRPFHAIWGWLEVGEVLTVDQLGANAVPWARYHPHFRYSQDPSNTLYVASDSGVFPRLADPLVLTDPAARLSTRWRLPSAFFPTGGKMPLSYHDNPERWRLEPPWCYLTCAARGQEFVLDLNAYPGLEEWVASLIEEAGVKTERGM